MVVILVAALGIGLGMQIGLIRLPGPQPAPSPGPDNRDARNVELFSNPGDGYELLLPMEWEEISIPRLDGEPAAGVRRFRAHISELPRPDDQRWRRRTAPFESATPPAARSRARFRSTSCRRHWSAHPRPPVGARCTGTRSSAASRRDSSARTPAARSGMASTRPSTTSSDSTTGGRSCSRSTTGPYGAGR